MERETKKERRGGERGVCWICSTDRCPPMFGEMFFCFFFNGLGRRVGGTLMQCKVKQRTTKQQTLGYRR